MLDIILSAPVTGQPVHVDVIVTTSCPGDRADLLGRAWHDRGGLLRPRRTREGATASVVRLLSPWTLRMGGEETASFVRRCGAEAEQRGVYRTGGGQSATACLWQEYSTLWQLGNAELVLSADGR